MNRSQMKRAAFGEMFYGIYGGIEEEMWTWYEGDDVPYEPRMPYAIFSSMLLSEASRPDFEVKR
jgi:hypothetical protein